MKIKVDKKEYEQLIERVTRLEKKVQGEESHLFESWKLTREILYDLMEGYFKTQCITTIVKRDKDEIIGEVRRQAMDNIFREEE